MKLEICDICKSYGKKQALDHVSLSLEPGIYGLLGPNGSGKTTLMSILTNNLKEDSGEILFDGGDIKKAGRTFFSRIGYMPQYPGLYPDFTVSRMMWYMAALKDVAGQLKGNARTESVDAEIRQLLHVMDLESYAGQKIRTLSGGTKQRLALALALLGSPDILILDEPTAGLDPMQRIALRNYIAQISFEKIVILATHVVPDVESIAQEIILLKDGAVLDVAPPDQLTAHLQGKVWSINCKENEIPEMQKQFRISNISQQTEGAEKTAVLRVLSDAKPAEGAVLVSPVLDDYYLFVFNTDAARE